MSLADWVLLGLLAVSVLGNLALFRVYRSVKRDLFDMIDVRQASRLQALKQIGELQAQSAALMEQHTLRMQRLSVDILDPAEDPRKGELRN